MSDNHTVSDNVRPIGNFQVLSDKKLRAVQCLLTAPNLRSAAEVVGVNERTLRRWSTEPAFVEAHRRARTEAYGVEMGLLQNRLGRALEVLDLALDGKATAGQLRAAELALRMSREAHETSDLRAEVEELKKLAAAGEDNGKAWGWINGRNS